MEFCKKDFILIYLLFQRMRYFRNWIKGGKIFDYKNKLLKINMSGKYKFLTVNTINIIRNKVIRI